MIFVWLTLFFNRWWVSGLMNTHSAHICEACQIFHMVKNTRLTWIMSPEIPCGCTLIWSYNGQYERRRELILTFLYSLPRQNYSYLNGVTGITTTKYSFHWERDNHQKIQKIQKIRIHGFALNYAWSDLCTLYDIFLFQASVIVNYHDAFSRKGQRAHLIWWWLKKICRGDLYRSHLRERFFTYHLQNPRCVNLTVVT